MEDLTLQQILEIHDRHQGPASFNIALGDGYCLNNSAIYRNTREHMAKLGYEFYESKDNFHNFYSQYTVLSLDEVFKLKRLPVINNVDSIKYLAKISRVDIKHKLIPRFKISLCTFKFVVFTRTPILCMF